MTKWEYCVMSVYGGELPLDGSLNWMDEMGEAGWELVNVDNGIAYFRRPKKIIGPTETKAGQGGPSV